MLVTVLIMLWDRFGVWEGALFPVVSTGRVVDSKMAQGQRRLTLAYTQQRENCVLLSIEWTWRDGTGKAHAIPWRTGEWQGKPDDATTYYLQTKLGPKQLAALTRHHCHMFWPVTSRLFP